MAQDAITGKCGFEHAGSCHGRANLACSALAWGGASMSDIHMTATARLAPLLALALVCACIAPQASAESLKADARTQALLRRAEFEQIVVSPNGELIAIASRGDTGSYVTINRVDDLKAFRRIDPGKNGEIDTLRWLDDKRVIVGANQSSTLFGMPLLPPSLFIVDVAPGGEIVELPANFVATIEGDPDHLLVARCTKWVDGDCVLEIRKAQTNHVWRGGEPVVMAPDSHSWLLPDDQGRVRFAMGWNKEGRSHTWVLGGDGKTWQTVNDEVKSGLSVWPEGVEADGKHGILIAERASGTNVVERYDFATGQRAELIRDAESDPLYLLHDQRTQAPIGAVFGATRPRREYWDHEHPQAKLYARLQDAFPGVVTSISSMSTDGNVAIVETSGDRDPGTYYVYDQRTNTARKLVRAMPWLDAETLASTRGFDFTARDGLRLHGLLTVPAGASGKGMPLVVMPHGGPFEISDSWGFDAEQQLLAAKGYAVLRVNFRGSGGYGKEFVNRGLRQWGKAMQDDVTDATRWAIEQGIADPKRVCIYGASYGAYAALMGAIREPNLYRCAAGYAGIYDLNKLYKWDNLRRSDLGKDFLRRAVGTDAADLAANSPAQHAGQIRANVFLAHGLMDSTSDIRFARAMEKAINKSGGQKVDLVEYPWQGHGLMRKDQSEDFYARLLRFLHDNLDAPATPAATATVANGD